MTERLRYMSQRPPTADLAFGQVAALVADRSNELAAERDRYARRILEDKMPRPLHWMLDRPKALRIALGVVRRWRPTMYELDLRPIPQARGEAETAVRNLLAESGLHGPTVVRYTDPSGLPAQVCGVE
ncbi:MAG TPA: hypothetical protein VLC07_00240 [Solirubrobacterales bacterium]|nr:hypothetical protein [Solirubrobacterales bacterium]